MTDPEKLKLPAKHPPEDARGAGADDETDEIQETAQREDLGLPTTTGSVARPVTLPGSKMPRPAG